MMPAAMPEHDRQALYALVKNWGLLRVLRALADLCTHWSTYYDPSPATKNYAITAIELRSVADRLDAADNLQPRKPS